MNNFIISRLLFDIKENVIKDFREGMKEQLVIHFYYYYYMCH